MRSYLPLVAGLLVWSACKNNTSPESQAFISVNSDTLVASRVANATSTIIRLSVPVTITNNGAMALTYFECASQLEKKTENGWVNAWTAICALAGDHSGNIQPGETRTFELDIVAALDGSFNPRWTADTLTAPFRVRTLLLDNGRNAELPSSASNEFIVRFDNVRDAQLDAELESLPARIKLQSTRAQ